jgi:SPX domain protein involved in polyphosphate accumulation
LKKDQAEQKFSRYEFKYILTNDLAKEIEDEVLHFMDYDGYIDPSLNNRYFVRSLYFDNQQSSSFYDKVDGIKKRSKYRIRTYTKKQNLKVPIFFEEKGRVESRTYKRRIGIEYKHLDSFLGNHHDLLLKHSFNNQLTDHFLYNRLRKSLKPCVLVDYYRRPYINKYGLYFRLTFDSNICSTSASTLFLDEDKSNKIACLSGYTILEVKFDRSIPPWFHRIIQAYQLSRISVSKFVLGMVSCKIAEDL